MHGHAPFLFGALKRLEVFGPLFGNATRIVKVARRRARPSPTGGCKQHDYHSAKSSAHLPLALCIIFLKVYRKKEVREITF
jgi:hypothetical protein